MREHDEHQRYGRDLWSTFLPSGSEVLRLFGVDTSDTVFERMQLGYDGTDLVLDSQAGPAGGTARDVVFRLGGVESGRFGTSGLKLKALGIDVSGHVPADTTNGTILSSGGVWTSYTYAGSAGVKLLLQNSCNTGEFATVRLRARANNTTSSGNGGNSVGTTTCIDASASANKAEYGVLKAVNACAQPNAFAQTTDSTNIVTALYGRVDRDAASVGRSWVGWLDTHATVRSDGSDHLLRLSHNGSVASDGAITIYSGGRLPKLFSFEDVSGFLSTSASGTFTKDYKIAVEIAGVGTRYIQVGSIA